MQITKRFLVLSTLKRLLYSHFEYYGPWTLIAHYNTTSYFFIINKTKMFIFKHRMIAIVNNQ